MKDKYVCSCLNSRALLSIPFVSPYRWTQLSTNDVLSELHETFFFRVCDEAIHQGTDSNVFLTHI